MRRLGLKRLNHLKFVFGWHTKWKCLSLFVTVALLQVVSMVERMQRSTTMLSVTGYVTLALAGASQGILPEFWLETNRWSQCSDINLSRHPSPSFREVLSILQYRPWAQDMSFQLAQVNMMLRTGPAESSEDRYGKSISHVIEMGVGGQVQWSLLRFDFLVFFLMVLSQFYGW